MVKHKLADIAAGRRVGGEGKSEVVRWHKHLLSEKNKGVVVLYATII